MEGWLFFGSLVPSHVMDLFSNWYLGPFWLKAGVFITLCCYMGHLVGKEPATLRWQDWWFPASGFFSIKGFFCFWARAFEACRDVFFEHLVARWEETMLWVVTCCFLCFMYLALGSPLHAVVCVIVYSLLHSFLIQSFFNRSKKYRDECWLCQSYCCQQWQARKNDPGLYVKVGNKLR